MYTDQNILYSILFVVIIKQSIITLKSKTCDQATLWAAGVFLDGTKKCCTGCNQRANVRLVRCSQLALDSCRRTQLYDERCTHDK